MRAQFIRFAVVGGVAAAANICSRMVFSLFMDYLPAISCAYIVGMTIAFLANRIWVFAPSGKHWTLEAGLFIAVNMFGLLQTLVISWWLARLAFPWIGLEFHPETIAHVVGVLAPIFTSYVGHRYLTFGTRAAAR